VESCHGDQGGPQLSRDARNDIEAILDYQVRTDGRELEPLSKLASVQETVKPSTRTQFQQLNAIRSVRSPRTASSLAMIPLLVATPRGGGLC
jgi:multidrug efflux pump